MENFTEFYEQALRAQEGLDALEEGQDENRLFLCHGDLNQHHLLMGTGEVAVIEFNQMHRGKQMADLYHLCGRLWKARVG